MNNQANHQKAKLRIIIVEDDQELLTVLVTLFIRFGHDVRGVGDGSALDLALADYPADVVVLDLNLPGEDGFDIAQRLRLTSSCGIIMTTERSQVQERVSGFERGADLYFVKPIDPLELNAALLNLVRRLSPPDSHSIKNTWHFDQQYSVIRTPLGISINLTAHECIVMQILLAVPGKTVSRSEMFSALGSPDDEYGGKRIDTLLSRFRSKVQRLDPEAELPIRALYGMGYVFFADLQQ